MDYERMLYDLRDWDGHDTGGVLAREMDFYGRRMNATTYCALGWLGRKAGYSDNELNGLGVSLAMMSTHTLPMLLAQRYGSDGSDADRVVMRSIAGVNDYSAGHRCARVRFYIQLIREGIPQPQAAHTAMARDSYLYDEVAPASPVAQETVDAAA